MPWRGDAALTLRALICFISSTINGCICWQGANVTHHWRVQDLRDASLTWSTTSLGNLECKRPFLTHNLNAQDHSQQAIPSKGRDTIISCSALPCPKSQRMSLWLPWKVCTSKEESETCCINLIAVREILSFPSRLMIVWTIDAWVWQSYQTCCVYWLTLFKQLPHTGFSTMRHWCRRHCNSPCVV